MNNMKMIVSYHLAQETPMWHFQSRTKSGTQEGAVLRGSDLKPRFDKFLIRQMTADNVVHEPFLLAGSKNALNYKVRIKALGNSKPKDMGKKAFIANMGSKEKEKDDEQSLFYPEGVELYIICFIPDLMEQIQKHIRAFFLITNFGTRQDKGFGGFRIDKKDEKLINGKDIDVLKEYSTKNNSNFSIYEVNTNGCSDSKALDNAYVLYQWMKSGINYGGLYKKSLLTEYMLTEYKLNNKKKHIGGEKRWMKQEGIAPKVKSKVLGDNRTIVADDRQEDDDQLEYRYIRAVMGVSGPQSWLTDAQYEEKGNTSYRKQRIEVSSKEIARFPSPITIKLIQGKLYFLVYDLDKSCEIFNKKFQFFNTNTKAEKPLYTLEAFDYHAFMDYCEKVVNGKILSYNGRTYAFNINRI